MASPDTLAILKDLSKKNGNNVRLIGPFLGLLSFGRTGLFRVRCTKSTVGVCDVWHLHMPTMLWQAQRLRCTHQVRWSVKAYMYAFMCIGVSRVPICVVLCRLQLCKVDNDGQMEGFGSRKNESGRK